MTLDPKKKHDWVKIKITEESVIFISILNMIKYLAPGAEGHGTEKVIEAVHKQSGKIKLIKGIIGGLLLAGLALAFSDRYLGLGLSAIQDALQGVKMAWSAFFLKIIFTSITLNFGGSGGIVTPIFFIGVTSGSLFAQIWGLDVATFSAIGMVALLAGAANTPIAASIMAVELFGPQIAPYAAVACVISFLMTGHRSVYPSQILSVSKSPSLELDIGDDIDSTHVHFKPRKKSLIGACLLGFETLKSRKNRRKR